MEDLMAELNNMLPDLQSSLMCDDVRQERNGKFMLIGLFDVIGAPSFPLVYPRIFMVTRWCSGQGTFHQRTRILGADASKPVAEGKKIPIRLPFPEATATNIEVFMNVSFPGAGTYWIEILLDGDLKLRYPLRVDQIAGTAGGTSGPTG